LESPERFGNWLRIIAVNECRRYLRRKRPRFVPVSEIGEGDVVLSEHLLPVDQQHDLQDQQREREHLEAAALTALNQLSEDNRQALTLYYLGGYTTEEVAAFLGTSGPAVKMRLHRVRKQLQKEGLMSRSSVSVRSKSERRNA